MNFFQDVRRRLILLDQQRIISIAWLQKWIVMLIVSFGALHYIWNWLVAEEDPNFHFPPGILPPDLRRKLPAHGFTNERDARAFALREIEFAVVACKNERDAPGKVAMDAITMMKSAALLSNAVIHFHIFTEDSLYSTFMNVLDEWPPNIRHRVSFKFRHVAYPESVLGWKTLYKPCSSFKLFLPHVLRDLDYIMYVDNDALFLNPVEDLWSNMLNYNSSHLLSLSAAQDNEYVPQDDSGAWYPKHSHLPYFGKTGLNSGIILYDVFRLRHSIFQIPVAKKKDCRDCKSFRDMFELKNMTWHPTMLRTLYELFSSEITMPDQDIFNIIFYFNPEKIYTLPCSWNFRWHYCESKRMETKSKFMKAILSSAPPTSSLQNLCNASYLVHGSGGVMDKAKYHEFEQLKQGWLDASYATPKKDLMRSLENLAKELKEKDDLVSSPRNMCMKINTELFIKSLKMCRTWDN